MSSNGKFNITCYSLSQFHKYVYVILKDAGRLLNSNIGDAENLEEKIGIRKDVIDRRDRHHKGDVETQPAAHEPGNPCVFHAPGS